MKLSNSFNICKNRWHLTKCKNRTNLRECAFVPPMCMMPLSMFYVLVPLGPHHLWTQRDEHDQDRPDWARSEAISVGRGSQQAWLSQCWSCDHTMPTCDWEFRVPREHINPAKQTNTQLGLRYQVATLFSISTSQQNIRHMLHPLQLTKTSQTLSQS